MLGTAPLLMANTYDSAKEASIYPFSFLPLITLGFTLLITFLLNCMTYSTKSALNSSSSMPTKFYKFSSFVSGLIIVQQSRSLKKLFINLRILFFDSTLSENPF
jgi:hypothetical protein